MSKFLLLLAALAAAWWLIRRLRARGEAGDADKKPRDPAAEQMVTCSLCGLYLPQVEAIAEGDKFYCSAEHRRRDA